MFNTDLAGIGVPERVRTLAGAEPVAPVWRNEAGGLTFAVGTGAGRRFVKWAPTGSVLDFAAEAARLRWAISYVTVPRVLGSGVDEAGSWLVMAGLPGRSAADPYWQSRPALAVPAVGAGLRRLHDALPVTDCPFSSAAQLRLADARARARRGLIDPALWHAEYHDLTVSDALAQLADIPDPDRIVVCHGDGCPPNTLLADDGSLSGHVDLGELGVADRWSDLAVATWSTTWNYGAGWERVLLDAYGIGPDTERIAYYRLLWQLGP